MNSLTHLRHSLGELDLRAAGAVFCADLEGSRKVLGRDVRGYLGMTFLKQYVIRLDFELGKVQFRRWDGRGHPDWGSKVHLFTEESSQIPIVKVALLQVGPVDCELDSGSNENLNLTPGLFSKTSGKMRAVEGLHETAAGTRLSRRSRIASLTLGGFAHRDLMVTESQDNRLGLGLLSRYVVTLDFPGMTMYLRATGDRRNTDEMDMSGLHLWCLNNRITVHSVDKGSPAWEAGIRSEDALLKAGEKSVTAASVFDVRDYLMSGEGKEVKLTL
jgi:hypothetical protein